APRGRTTYWDTFLDVVRQSPIKIVAVGGKGDLPDEPDLPLVDFTERDYLTTASLISEAKGFVGIMSSQLVIANGFPIPKVIPHDGKSWDMRHIIRSNLHHYLVNPTADAILEVFHEETLHQAQD
ncbi:MAG TPA: hypothetical protein VF433_07605, partial [Cellvibrio sp.]